MADATKQIQAKGKQEVTSTAERLTPGRYYTPAVDIFEDENTITVAADMPGVDADALNVDLRDDVLTLMGEVPEPETSREEILVREYGTGKFFRQFELSNIIDQAKIKAELVNGVLRLTLPKVEPAKPRKIQIRGE